MIVYMRKIVLAVLVLTGCEDAERGGQEPPCPSQADRIMDACGDVLSAWDECEPDPDCPPLDSSECYDTCTKGVECVDICHEAYLDALECHTVCDTMAIDADECRAAHGIQESLPWIAVVCEVDDRVYGGGVCVGAEEMCWQ